MLPHLAQLNTADEVLRDPKVSGKFRSCYLPSCRSDGQHVGLSEFGPRALTTPAKVGRRRRCETYAMRMTLISGRCEPFQVRGSVVDLDAVDVIRLLAVDGSTDKGGEDEAVNPEVDWPVMTAQLNIEIARGTQVRFENATRVGIAGPSSASHPSEVRDLVETFVPNDRSPILGFQNKGELCRLRVHRKVNSFRCHVAGRLTPSRPHLLYPEVH